MRAAVALPSPALVASTANAAQAVVRRGPKKRLLYLHGFPAPFFFGFLGWRSLIYFLFTSELTEMPQTNEDRIAKLFISADGKKRSMLRCPSLLAD